MNGKITVERVSGTEVFGFDEIGFMGWNRLANGRTSICFAVEADTVIKPLDFTEEICPNPIVEVSVFDDDFDPSSLANKSYSVPKSFDENLADSVSMFYYNEHLDLNEIEIKILGQEGNICHVTCTGVAEDNCHNSPANVRVLVDGKFKVSESQD